MPMLSIRILGFPSRDEKKKSRLKDEIARTISNMPHLRRTWPIDGLSVTVDPRPQEEKELVAEITVPHINPEDSKRAKDFLLDLRCSICHLLTVFAETNLPQCLVVKSYIIPHIKPADVVQMTRQKGQHQFVWKPT